jgi:two-component system, cell cycle response regulator
MLAKSAPNFLLASPEPALLSKLEPLLAGQGGQVHIALTGESALALLATPIPPSLFLLDVNLPGIEIGQWLAAAQVATGLKRLPIVLISDTVAEEFLDCLAEGVVADIVPGHTELIFWQVRIDNALRSHRASCELDLLRESTALNAQFDRLTNLYNRETMLSMLFRETDRVQRLKSSLAMILFDVEDFGDWNSRLGEEACDGLLCQIVSRAHRLLRSYDLLGRVGADEFLLALPGCTRVNAQTLAERLRVEVFGEPLQAAGESVRLSACFGISLSNGRSPVVVLREAEQALALSRNLGPESIQCFEEYPQQESAPVSFFSLAIGDEMLAW